MRIAIVTNESLGEGLDAPSGFSSRYVLLARCLADMGHDVLAVSFGKGRPAIEPATPLRAHPNIEYRSVDSLGGALSSADRVRRAVRGVSLRLGSTAYARPWEREISLAISQFRPGVVFVAAPFRQATSALSPRGLPLVFFAEEDLSTVSNVQDAKSIGNVERARRIDVVVTISESERNWAERRFGGVPVAVVPHVVDVDYWAARSVEPAANAPDVFCVGDFSHGRNAVGLREVLRSMGSGEVDLPPTRVGVATARPFDALDSDDGVDIEILGPVDDLRPFYQGCKIALVPSFMVTGVKTQILQAWASGVPVVTTSAAAETVGGCDGRDVVAGDDPAAVVRGMAHVLSDPTLRRHLIDAGRARVRDHYSNDGMTAALQLLVDRVEALATLR